MPGTSTRLLGTSGPFRVAVAARIVGLTVARLISRGCILSSTCAQSYIAEGMPW